MAEHQGGETYILTLRALPADVPPEVRLRRCLKHLLRSLQFRAVSVRDATPELPDAGQGDEGEPVPMVGAGPTRGGTMRVSCAVVEIEMEGDHAAVEGVQVECSRCGHQTESYGTSGASVRRCLAGLREECPNGESNFYVAARAQG
jgi:hypothetical protein